MRSILILLVKIYTFTFSSLVGNCCRFYPTCSSYASESINKHGAIRGVWLTTRRVLRCHPWCQGGHDPVP